MYLLIPILRQILRHSDIFKINIFRYIQMYSDIFRYIQIYSNIFIYIDIFRYI